MLPPMTEARQYTSAGAWRDDVDSLLVAFFRKGKLFHNHRLGLTMFGISTTMICLIHPGINDLLCFFMFIYLFIYFRRAGC